MEEGRLYMLQTRDAKRPAQAAVRFAVDAVGEGLLTREEALATIDAEALEALLHPTFDPQAEVTSHGLRRGGVARRRQGRHRLHRSRRGRGGGRRARGRPRAPLHRGRRRRGLPRGPGRPDQRGRQGLARGARGARHGRPRRHRAGTVHVDLAPALRAHRRPRPARGRPAWRSTAPRARSRRDDVPLVEPEITQEFRHRAGLGRRAAPPRRARERRHRRGRRPGPGARGRGHRPLPDRAHVLRRGPPARRSSA